MKYYLPLIPLLCLFLVGSCGLKYDPTPLNEHTTESRRMILQSKLKSDFEKEGKKYISLAFGESVVQKPVAYKTLDSLFQLKYYANLNGLNPKQYDNQIEVQQAVIQTDTSRIKYIETNFMELKQDTLCEFLVAECVLTKTGELLNFSVLDDFTTSTKYERFAQLYMKEENFSGYGSEVAQEDLRFYSYVKNHAANLVGKERDAFLIHVFHLMAIGEKDHSVKNLNFLTRLSQEQLVKKVNGITLSDFDFTVEKIISSEEGSDDFYEVAVRKISEKTPYTIFRYDLYLMPIQTEW